MTRTVSATLTRAARPPGASPASPARPVRTFRSEPPAENIMHPGVGLVGPGRVNRDPVTGRT
eukprot:84227-Hanusia_phi.AAC.1